MDDVDPQEAAPQGAEFKAELDRLDELVRTSAGAVFASHVATIANAFDEFSDSYQQLHSLLVAAETDEDTMFMLMSNVPPLTEKRAFERRMDRAIKSFCGDLVTVVDVTRKAMRKQPEEFQGVWDDINRTGPRAVPGALILRELRNYLDHENQAPWWFTGRVDSNGARAEVLLSPKPLLRSTFFTAPARAYLEANPDGVRLLTIIDSYYPAMAEAWSWLLEKYQDVNAAGIQAMNDLIGQRNLHLTDGVYSNAADFHAAVSKGMETLREEQLQPRVTPSEGV